MTNKNRIEPLSISVVFAAEEVALDLRDRRPDSITLFGELEEPARDQLAHDAWAIGLRALANAHQTAQESKLKDVGAALLGDIDRQLKVYVEQQQQTIGAILTRFFDPNDGQVTQRLSAFVDDQGVLARQLQKFLGPQGSVLAETLAKQVGETSPLFKKLSPTDSTGLVKVLESQLRAVMGEGRAELVRALDPLAEDGAVARFLKSLRDELKGADEDRQKQLSAALAALDANDEQSLLSRLVRETERSRCAVLSAVNPEAPASPMAMLKASLSKLLLEQSTAQLVLVKRQEERQVQFEKEVREALVRIETKRTQELKSTRGGLVFEDAVLAFVRSATKGAPCVFDATGATAGVGRSKKGDAVVRFTHESAFSGAGVVFEAKRDASYSVQKALDELDAARKNRDAAAGVFVMARSHASDVFPRFARYGNNVLVVWDDQDPLTDAYLHAAVLLGVGLVTRTKTVGDEGDLAALRDIEKRIEDELARLTKMEKHSENIRKNLGNPYVAARELAGTPEYYVSHASAMDLHQMVTQPQLAIFVTSPRRSGCVPCSGRSSASCAASRRTCLASSTGVILGAGVNCVVRKFVNRACLLPKCATTENYASRVVVQLAEGAAAEEAEGLAEFRVEQAGRQEVRADKWRRALVSSEVGSRAELARREGVSRAWVTKVLGRAPTCGD